MNGRLLASPRSSPAAPSRRGLLRVTASAAGFFATLGAGSRATEVVQSAAADGITAADTSTSPRVKAQSDASYALALTAAGWGAPLVTMYNLRYHDAFGATPKAPPNQLWRMTDISTPRLSEEAGYVTPNVNTVYGFGFLDLQPEPVIMKLPDSHGRYYMVEVCDMWTNAFAYPAGATHGYKGGTFALVGPGSESTLPAGVIRIDSPTRWVLIQPRVHVAGSADLPQARAVLESITLQGLAAFSGKQPPAKPSYHYPAPHYLDPKQPVSALDYKDPLQFWQILSIAMNENPPPGNQIEALLPLFKPLGLQLDKQWVPSSVNPIVRNSMKDAAAAIGRLLDVLPSSTPLRGSWELPAPSIGDFGTAYWERAIIGRVGLTANTPQEAIYVLGLFDGSGQSLTGARRYIITFHQLPPYVPPGFWSVTMYDASNNYTVPNPIGRYSIGSDNALEKSADGTTTIYLQQDDPGKSRRGNWLPSPSGAFYLILRVYAPGPAMIESLTNPDAYVIPTIEAAR
jgi:hypothetical protein